MLTKTRWYVPTTIHMCMSEDAFHMGSLLPLFEAGSLLLFLPGYNIFIVFIQIYIFLCSPPCFPLPLSLLLKDIIFSWPLSFCLSFLGVSNPPQSHTSPMIHCLITDLDMNQTKCLQSVTCRTQSLEKLLLFNLMHTALGKKRLDQAHWCSRAVPASQICYAERGCSSVVGCLPNICKALGFIPALPKLKNKHSRAWTRCSDWFPCFKAIMPYLTRYSITTELKWRSCHALRLNMGLHCTGIRKGSRLHLQQNCMDSVHSVFWIPRTCQFILKSVTCWRKALDHSYSCIWWWTEHCHWDSLTIIMTILLGSRSCFCSFIL